MSLRPPSWVPEALLYALTAFGPLAFGCVEPWSRAVLEVLIALLALSCFLRGPREVPAAAAWLWLAPAAIAAIGGLQLLSPVAADMPRPSVPFTVAVAATRGSVLLWASYAALMWSVPQVLAVHEAARRFSRAVFGVGLFVSAQGLLQLATGSGRLYWFRPAGLAAAFGPYYDRDHAANLLLMAGAMGAGILLSRRKRRPAVDGAPPDHLRSQARLASGVALIAAAAAACGSRGAALAIPFAAATLWFARAAGSPDSRSRAVGAAVALGAAAFAAYFTFRHVAAGVEAGGRVDWAVAERFMIYADSWRWAREAPVFGTGLGSFETVYPSYQDTALAAVVSHAHSDWLELLLETGMAGASLALASAAWAAVSAARTWRSARSSEMRALIAGASAAAVAFAVHSLIDFNLQIPGNAAVFFAIVGFLLSAPAWADKAAPRPRDPAPPSWKSVAAAACAAGLVVAAVRPLYAADPGDPLALRRAAALVAARADRGGVADVSSLRAGLRLAVAAARMRPFDYRALELEGRFLWRLGRGSDSRLCFERAHRVRFTPVVVGEGTAVRPGEESGVSRLRALGLLGEGDRR